MKFAICGFLLGAGVAIYPAMAGYLHAFKDEPMLSAGESFLLVLVTAIVGGLSGCIADWWVRRRKKSE